jgi:hypothetical protein
VLNLVDRVLEVYRQPVADPAAFYGWKYESVSSLPAGSSVAPLVLPGTPIAVIDLLP